VKEAGGKVSTRLPHSRRLGSRGAGLGSRKGCGFRASVRGSQRMRKRSVCCVIRDMVSPAWLLALPRQRQSNHTNGTRPSRSDRHVQEPSCASVHHSSHHRDNRPRAPTTRAKRVVMCRLAHPMSRSRLPRRVTFTQKGCRGVLQHVAGSADRAASEGLLNEDRPAQYTLARSMW